MAFLTKISNSFQEAIDQLEEVNTQLAKYSKEYRGVSVWRCWAAENEIRCAGQHLCRSLGFVNSENDRKEEERRADTHCRKAVHDAKDLLIIFYTAHIRSELTRMHGAGCRGKEEENFKYWQKVFWSICHDISQNHRIDECFGNKRDTLIDRLETMFLSLMKRHIRENGQSKIETTTLEPVLLRGFEEEICVPDLVKNYDEAEEYFKMFELLNGKAMREHITLISDAARCLIDLDGYVNKKQFWLRCCKAQMTILMHTLWFLLVSSGLSKDETARVMEKYNSRIIFEGCNFYDVKRSLLGDIENFFLDDKESEEMWAE